MEENLIRFCRINKAGKPFDIVENSIEEYIVENYDIFVIFEKPYVYQGGVYRQDDRGILTQDIIKALIIPSLRSDARILRVYKLLLKDRRLQMDIEEVNKYQRHWINFLNGMLDIKTGILHQHSPDYCSVSQIPHDYKPGLDFEKSTFNRFLMSRIPDEDNREMLFEFLGVCLLPDIIFQKFLILVGVGNAGKSIILNLLARIVGRENLSAIPLQGLSERFTTASLLNKTCNICGDLPNSAIKDTSVIKQLTGEDYCKGEYKGGEIFFFRNRAKFLFSCNELPTILDDRSNGFYRRLLVIRFEQEGEFITDLYRRLEDEKEVQTIISRLVEGAKLALERGKIKESGANLGEISKLQEESDTVQLYINQNTIVDSKSRVKRPDLFQSYIDFCKAEQRIPLGKTAFFKALRTKGYRETKVQGVVYISGLELGYISADDTPFDV